MLVVVQPQIDDGTLLYAKQDRNASVWIVPAPLSISSWSLSTVTWPVMNALCVVFLGLPYYAVSAIVMFLHFSYAISFISLYHIMENPYDL